MPGARTRQYRQPATRRLAPPLLLDRTQVGQGLLILAVEAVEVLIGLLADPGDRREQVPLDVGLLPLRGLDDLLECVLPPLDGLGPHAGGPHYAAHLLPVELVAFLGES